MNYLQSVIELLEHEYRVNKMEIMIVLKEMPE